MRWYEWMRSRLMTMMAGVLVSFTHAMPVALAAPSIVGESSSIVHIITLPRPSYDTLRAGPIKGSPAEFLMTAELTLAPISVTVVPVALNHEVMLFTDERELTIAEHLLHVDVIEASTESRASTVTSTRLPELSPRMSASLRVVYKLATPLEAWQAIRDLKAILASLPEAAATLQEGVISTRVHQDASGKVARVGLGQGGAFRSYRERDRVGRFTVLNTLTMITPHAEVERGVSVIQWRQWRSWWSRSPPENSPHGLGGAR